MNKIFILLGVAFLIVAAMGVENIPTQGLGIALFPGFMGVTFLIVGYMGEQP
jgi:hypothetical protein